MDSEVRLDIGGMMCMKNCGTTVQNALRTVPGVVSADVSFETHSATIVPGTASVADLIDAVECVGFGAESKCSTFRSRSRSVSYTKQLLGNLCPRRSTAK